MEAIERDAIVMKKRKTYSGAFKAEVVFAYISGVKSLNDLAKQYSVHPNQIKNWKSILLKRASEILTDRRRGRSDQNGVHRHL